MQIYSVVFKLCLKVNASRRDVPSRDCQENTCLFYRGLFITIHDRGHIATMLNSWPDEDIKVPDSSYFHTQLLYPWLIWALAAGHRGNRRRAYPRPGRPGQLRNGHSCGEAGALHSLRRRSTAAVSPRAAGRRHRQPGVYEHRAARRLWSITLQISSKLQKLAMTSVLWMICGPGAAWWPPVHRAQAQENQGEGVRWFDRRVHAGGDRQVSRIVTDQRTHKRDHDNSDTSNLCHPAGTGCSAWYSLRILPTVTPSASSTNTEIATVHSTMTSKVPRCSLSGLGYTDSQQWWM